MLMAVLVTEARLRTRHVLVKEGAGSGPDFPDDDQPFVVPMWETMAWPAYMCPDAAAEAGVGTLLYWLSLIHI